MRNKKKKWIVKDAYNSSTLFSAYLLSEDVTLHVHDHGNAIDLHISVPSERLLWVQTKLCIDVDTAVALGKALVALEGRKP